MTKTRPNAHHSDRVQQGPNDIDDRSRVHVKKSKSKRNSYAPYVIEFTESNFWDSSFILNRKWITAGYRLQKKKDWYT